MERTAKLQWATMITVYCISYAPALLLLQIPGYEGANELLLVYLLLIVQLSDVLQYVFGKLFGRTKLASVVSSSKPGKAPSAMKRSLGANDWAS